MNFASVAGAWALSGLLFILAMYLLKRRHEPIEVSSVFLWQRAMADAEANRPFQKLRRNLLMFLQLLAALLLALSLMRPMLAGVGEAGETALVIDASASMQTVSSGQSRFDEAIADAKKRVSGMQPGERVSIIVAGAQVRQVVARATDKSDALRALDALSPENGGADMDGALSLAMALQKEIEGLSIIAYSDAYALPEGADATLIAVGQPEDNRAVSSLTLAERADGMVALAHVTNHGAAREITLECLADGLLCDARTVSLGENETASVYFSVPEGARVYAARIAESDALAADDVRTVTRSDSGAVRAIISGADNVFLETALRLREDIELVRGEVSAAPGATLVVLDGVLPEALPEKASLLLVNPPEAIPGIEPGEAKTPASGLSATYGEPAATLLRHVDPAAIALAKYRPITSALSPILKIGEDVLLAAGEMDGRRVVALGFDLHDSNLPMLRDFPILMQNLLEYLAPQTLPGGANADCGEQIAIVRHAFAEDAFIETPSGARMALATPFSDTNEIGVYTLAQTLSDGGLAVSHFTAHTPAEESDARRIATGAAGSAGILTNPYGIELTFYAILISLLLLLLMMLLDRRISALRPRKRRVSFSLRAACAVLLAASLFNPSVFLRANEAATWVLVDASASTQGSRAGMERALSDALQNAPDDLKTGVIAFGRNAMVESSLSYNHQFSALQTLPDARGTDLARALGMAGALLPDDVGGRLLVLSDGRENAGSALSQATALAARGIAVDVMAFPAATGRDAQVSALESPGKLYQGEGFSVTVRMDSTFDTDATLVLYANRQPVLTQAITLRRGENAFVFQDVAKTSGVVTYEAQLTASGDENPRNNRMGAYIDVRGVPMVLLVEGAPGAGDELGKMLAATGMAYETITPERMPQSAEALRKYHAVALVNADADAFAEEALSALDGFVRRLGRGLAVFGGENAYALGGYRGSALEDMLPVTMDVDNRLDVPTLALALVIDKSGSMTDGRYGITKLELAKEAAMRACEVLTARDSIGVIAFDDTAKWAVPMQTVKDVNAILEMIGTIRPGGGTAFYSALSEAYRALSAVEAQKKHVIFLTDGESADGGYEEIVRQMALNEITLTSVAVGSGANVRILRNLAELGGGRAYVMNEFDNIPKVFTKETMLATDAYVQNRRFFPFVYGNEALTDFDAFPALDGYTATTLKPLARLVMASDREEPILAWWQYGAGRALAWTSDVQGAWTADYLGWEHAAAFFAGMLAHVLPEDEGEGSARVETKGDAATVRLELPEDAPLEDLSTIAQVLRPDGEQETIQLSDVAPGVYEGHFDAALEGAYAVRVEQLQGGALVRSVETGAAVSYADEYDLRASDDTSALEALANATGGRVLTDPSEFFTARGEDARSRVDLRPALLVAALAIFLLDVALRRLPWLDRKREKPEHPEKKKREAKPSVKAQIKPTEPQKPAESTATQLLEMQRKRRKL